MKVLFINCQSGHDSMHMRGQADEMARLLTLLPDKFPGRALSPSTILPSNPGTTYVSTCVPGI